MQKICFVIPRAYYLFNHKISGADDKVGGAQKQAHIISTGLAEDSNFDVHFCVADFGQDNFEIRQDVKLWKSFNFSDSIFKRTQQLVTTIKKINADTYIFRSADTGVAFALFYIKLILKKKVFYMISADAETTKQRLRKYAGFLTAFSMQRVYKKADIITAQTQQQADIFEKCRKRKPDAVIKNIYLSENKLANINEEKKNILWVGRLNMIKNPEIFLNLAKKYPKERFVMIAPIVRDHKKYGIKVHQKAKKIKNLHLLNFVNPTEINVYFKKAKIYTLTSDLEGFSNTMAEAMIAECAILSYNVNPDGIFNKFECGFCADTNLNLFYKKFEELNSKPLLIKKLGNNGANYISNNHKKGNIIQEFKALL